MNQNNFWLKTFNVRAEEVGVVKKLFFLQFFQGAGIAFFLTASLTLLLEKFHIEQIPYVFIFSAGLLWITGFIYSKLEHKYPLHRVAFMITIFMIVSILLFRLAFIFREENYFVFIMLPWFYVLYLLNNLEFWGVASLIFDARQSKRLFAVISAGDIPAKMIGYSIAGLTVHYIGTINLLWAALACLLASIPFLITVKEATILEEHHKHHNHHQHKSNTHNKKPEHNINKIIDNFFGNDLIRSVALLGILMSMSFLIINFSFWTKVKHAYHDDVSLANFIAFFNAIISIVFLFFKLIFTSRLINKIGIIKSLLITPLVLLIMIGLVIYSERLDSQTLILYCFGATYSIVDILKTSINNPVFLTVMQPLPNHERLRAHMILKGITDPFAFLFAGIAIIFLIKYQGKVDLATMSYLILAICLFWFAGVYALNKQYLKTIVKSISNKFFNLDNLSIHDTDTLQWLKEKAKKGSEIEVLNIISMLSHQPKDLNDDLIITIFKHPSDKVKLALLNVMLEHEFPHAAQSLIKILSQDMHPAILARAIKVVCKNNIQTDETIQFLSSAEKEIRNATIDGLFFYANGEAKQKATLLLQQLMNSENDVDRVDAAHILSNHYHGKETAMISQLMNDKNHEVRKFAFIAAGKSENDFLLDQLIQSGLQYEFEMIEPLLLSGAKSLPHIYNYLRSNKNIANPQKEKLILLISRINNEFAHELLVKLLQEFPQDYNIIIKAIYRSSFTPKQKEINLFTDNITQLLSNCANIIHLQHGIKHNNPNPSLLVDALHLELETLRETLLFLFGIVYNRNKINKVRVAFATGVKANIINAMELIDITVKKDFAHKFNTIFEPGNTTERIHDIEKLYPNKSYKNSEEILTTVIFNENGLYNNWTISSSIYLAKKQGIHIDISLIHKLSQSENKLVNETSKYYLSTTH
jgi:ATP/ADP translocase